MTQDIKLTKAEERELNVAMADILGAIGDLGSIEHLSRHEDANKGQYIKYAEAAEVKLTNALKWADQIRKLSTELEERLIAQRGGKGVIAKEERWAIGVSKSLERGLSANRRRVLELLKLIKDSPLKKSVSFFGKNDFKKINALADRIRHNLTVISTFVRKLKELELHIEKLERASFY